MLDLTRTVRFCLTEDPADLRTARDNTFSAWPAVRGLSRYYELEVTCRGEADPVTGYFMNIKAIDEAVRTCALPVMQRTLTEADRPAAVAMGALMRHLHQALQPALERSVASVRLRLSPMTSLTIETKAMDHVVLRQEFEFSAAHRLHVAELSEEENRQVFGKCNNPAGHGHNYQLEVAVRAPIGPAGRTLDVARLDQRVNRHAIEKLDHKHLNHDVPQFTGLNPSVEHIAQVIWGMLEKPIAELGAPSQPAQLVEVRVWETGKTVCTYRGPTPTSASIPASTPASSCDKGHDAASSAQGRLG